MPQEDEKERIDRELRELLEEIRVAIPGAQVLFAFLLTVAFTDRIFKATQLQRNVYFVTLMTTAAAIALMIAPSAYHRLNFRGDTAAKEKMLFTSTRLAIASLALLLLAVAGAVFLVGDVLYETWVGVVMAAIAAMWFSWFWFGLGLHRRSR